MRIIDKKVFGLVVVISIILILGGLYIIKRNKEETNSVPSYSISIRGFELNVQTDFNKEEVITRGYPTMLDIGGGDCIACKQMKPILEKLNEEWQGLVIVKFVDYWKYPHLADQFNFKVIPTQFFYDDKGKLFKTHEGAITEAEIRNIFEEMGYEFNE